MSEIRDQLKDLVTKGLAQDIFEAEVSFHIFRRIQKHAKAIDGPRGRNLSPLFGSLNAGLQRDVVMSVSRLYDVPSRKRKTRCILSVVRLLEANIDNLPKIQEPYSLSLELERAGIVVDQYAEDSEFSQSVLDGIRQIVSNQETQQLISRLRHYRNKRFAHNEAKKITIAPPDWDEVFSLLEKAQQVVGLIGWAYLGIAYTMQDGRYPGSSDAKRPSVALERVLRDLDVIDRPSRGIAFEGLY